MKIVKILSALLAVAGTVALIVAFGDKIVAWCKKLCPCCKPCGGDTCCKDAVEAPEEAPVEETPEETTVEAPAEEPVEAPEEAPAEAPVEAPAENEPVAEDGDFEG